MVSVEYSEAIVEVLEILKYTDKKILEKIPNELLKVWERDKSKTYKPKLDYSKKLEEMDLKPKTRALIAMIYADFICTAEEKKEIDKKMLENENKKQEEIRAKYDPDRLFEKKEKRTEQFENNVSLKTIEKESVLKRIIRVIKNLMKLK